MSGIGHNRGPSLEGGTSWRRHCWTKARRDLLPTLPIEVVRLRVKRAAEVGLDYRTYASFRAASGHDIIALLFSSNALRVFPPNLKVPEDRATKLTQLKAVNRSALANAPLTPKELLHVTAGMIGHAAQAPRPFANWSEIRERLANMVRTQNWPADQILMIGDTTEEQLWSEAGRLGGYLPAERYFAS